MAKMTTTHLISGLLKTTPENQWDDVILPVALEWNRKAYKIPEDTVRGMYEAISNSQRKINNLWRKQKDTLESPPSQVRDKLSQSR